MPLLKYEATTLPEVSSCPNQRIGSFPKKGLLPPGNSALPTLRYKAQTASYPPGNRISECRCFGSVLGRSSIHEALALRGDHCICSFNR